jgi:hypothetical protein
MPSNVPDRRVSSRNLPTLSYCYHIHATLLRKGGNILVARLKHAKAALVVPRAAYPMGLPAQLAC